MKRKYTNIILAVLIMATIVTFSMIGCKKVTVITPATKAPTTTTAAPTTTKAATTTTVAPTSTTKAPTSSS